MLNYTNLTNLRDIVFPLAKCVLKDEQLTFEQHIGTGFYFGLDGFAITASHVLDQLEIQSHPSRSYAMFVIDGKWAGFQVESYEQHPTEDIAIIKIKNRLQKSWFNISQEEIHAGFDYFCWGYPFEVTEELEKSRSSADELFMRPDLVFTKGYVRRRITRELPFSVFKGSNFLELSTVSGDGCSGAPVTDSKNSSIVGVYIGSGPRVGYSLRISSIKGWSPEILGKCLF